MPTAYRPSLCVRHTNSNGRRSPDTPASIRTAKIRSSQRPSCSIEFGRWSSDNSGCEVTSCTSEAPLACAGGNLAKSVQRLDGQLPGVAAASEQTVGFAAACADVQPQRCCSDEAGVQISARNKRCQDSPEAGPSPAVPGCGLNASSGPKPPKLNPPSGANLRRRRRMNEKIDKGCCLDFE